MSCATTGLSCLKSAFTEAGSIQIILGPMFSGKTTELIRRMRRYQVANHSCLMIKYSKDDRYDKDGIATHDKTVSSATGTTKLKNLTKCAFDFGVIGIDEGQFFPDLVEFCEMMADAGKTVIVAALNGTFQRKPFGSVLDLIPLAESVDKLNAVCMICFKDASFTKRITKEQEVEVIGGADKYMAVCRICYQLPSIHQQQLLSSETPIRDEKILDYGGRKLLFDPSDEDFPYN